MNKVIVGQWYYWPAQNKKVLCFGASITDVTNPQDYDSVDLCDEEGVLQTISLTEWETLSTELRILGNVTDAIDDEGVLGLGEGDFEEEFSTEEDYDDSTIKCVLSPKGEIRSKMELKSSGEHTAKCVMSEASSEAKAVITPAGDVMALPLAKTTTKRNTAGQICW